LPKPCGITAGLFLAAAALFASTVLACPRTARPRKAAGGIGARALQHHIVMGRHSACGDLTRDALWSVSEWDLTFAADLAQGCESAMSGPHSAASIFVRAASSSANSSI